VFLYALVFIAGLFVGMYCEHRLGKADLRAREADLLRKAALRAEKIP
jgi:hypothetical protein